MKAVFLRPELASDFSIYFYISAIKQLAGPVGLSNDIL